MRQFFEDNAGMLSMNRLTLFGAFIALTLVLIIQAITGTLNEMYYGLYCGAFVAPYVTGKITDKQKENDNVDKT